MILTGHVMVHALPKEASYYYYYDYWSSWKIFYYSTATGNNAKMFVRFLEYTENMFANLEGAKSRPGVKKSVVPYISA